MFGGRASQPEKQAASTSQFGVFETETLHTKTDFKKLMVLYSEWIEFVHLGKPPKKQILDMDIAVGETFGQQE